MKNHLLTIVLLTNTLLLFSQGGGVGINDTGAMPDTSAILDISSSNKGLLIPRLSLTDTADITTISGATNSLIVHNTNSAMIGGNGTGLYQWNGTKWIKLIAPENGPGSDGQILTSQGTGKAAAWKTGGGGSSSGCAARKRVFVTSTSYTGNLGGLAGADAKCQARADAAGLGGTWIAILSGGGGLADSAARARIPYDWDLLVDVRGRPIVTVDRIWRTANNSSYDFADFNMPIQITELGTFSNNLVWTGTSRVGLYRSPTCSNWTSTAGNGAVGWAGDRTEGWIEYTSAGSIACTQNRALYCIEE